MFKKNEILPFVTTWIDIEGIMLSETSQTEKDNCYMILYVELKTYKQTPPRKFFLITDEAWVWKLDGGQVLISPIPS